MKELRLAATQMLALKEDLNKVFFERNDEINALQRAIVAEEHVLLLGLPGTAKSNLINEFGSSFGYKTFVTLLARDSKADQVFGPYDIPALQKGSRIRKTRGYLPEAELGFIDECFKANSTVLNNMLTILQERSFDNGCAGRIDVPLQMLVGASNEFPEDESLSALYDRFVLRRWVNPIRDSDNFKCLISGHRKEKVDVKVDRAQIDILREARKKVNVDAIIDPICSLKEHLDDSKFYVSDRRWLKALKVIKAATVLRGELVATSKDMLVLADVLWDKKEQRPALLSALTQYLGGNMKRALKVVGGVIEIFKELSNIQGDHGVVGEWDIETCFKVATSTKDVGHLCKMNQMLNEPIDNLRELSNEDEECLEIFTEVKNLQEHVKALTRKKIGL